MNIDAYPLTILPAGMVPYDQMNRQQAKTHFDWFMSLISMRLTRLRAFFESDFGSSSELDFSPESLVSLWKWVIPHCRLVPTSEEELAAQKSQAPEWVWNHLSKDTLYLGTRALATDVAVYVAEVFMRQYPGLVSWGFVTRPKSLVHVNRPILIRGAAQMHILGVMEILPLRAARGDTDPETLLRVYKMWCELLHLEDRSITLNWGLR